jgi:hypothetical protein
MVLTTAMGLKFRLGGIPLPVITTYYVRQLALKGPGFFILIGTTPNVTRFVVLDLE